VLLHLIYDLQQTFGAKGGHNKNCVGSDFSVKLHNDTHTHTHTRMMQL